MSQTQEQEIVAEDIRPEGKPTLVLGASTNPDRVSFTAINMLRRAGHTVYAIGGRAGVVSGVRIHTDPAELPMPGLHTISLYLGAARQEQYYDLILGLRPERLIFNPGAENPELFRLATEAGIEAVEACTLVMLSLRQF